MLRIVRKSDLVWLPWKNGAGEMADVATSTARTPAGDPEWRVSMARVTQDSAFSHFPDLERGMMLIEGKHLDLLVAVDPALRVQVMGPAVTFDGDRPTRGVPTSGGIVNLNVMVRRGVMRQRMIRWTLQGAAWVPVAPGGATFVFVQSGQMLCSGHEGRVCEAGDTLLLDMPLQVRGVAEVIEVALWPAAGT